MQGWTIDLGLSIAKDFAISLCMDLVVVGCLDGGIITVSLRAGIKKEVIPNAHSDIVSGIVILERKQQFVSAGEDGCLVIWTKECQTVFKTKCNRVAALFVDAKESKLLILQSMNKRVDIISLNDLSMKKDVICEHEAIKGIKICPEDEFLVILIGNEQSEIHFWRLDNY